MIMCSGCGRGVYKGREVCSVCRRSTDDSALVGGKWIGGLVKTWVPDPEPPMIHLEPLLCGTTCHCGCLLLPGEDCPACLYESIRAEVAA